MGDSRLISLSSLRAKRRYDKATDSNLERTLMDILVPYETRKSLLMCLSAYDIAKLDLSLNHILDKTERQIYLNPMRDLFWNVPEMNTLLQEGMQLMLLG